MNMNSDMSNTRPCWFVGASFNKVEDQTDRFLRDGIWENDFDDDHPFVAMTKTMQVGDRIAIKATYVRRNGLPFNNNGLPVSVMAIKAIGSIVENVGDGHTVRVGWTRVNPIREWYMYTHIKTIWKVTPGSDRWLSDALIGFAFDNVKQDIERFLKVNYWRERYVVNGNQRYAWTSFYEAFANTLLAYKDRRTDLINRIHAVATKEDSMYLVQDRFSDGTTGPLKDICPFTIMGMFNRQIKDANRITVATELANQLGVSEPVPDELKGIPVVDNRSSWFFNFEKDREPDDIDVLWDVFSSAMSFADTEDFDTLSAFVSTYDSAIKQPNVGWKLSFGLYWIRPWSFPSLDTLARDYIENELNIAIGLNGPKNRCNADDYLGVRESLDARFKDEGCPVKSFPQLAYEVWMRKVPPPPLPKYTLDDIIKDGCFIDRSKLKTMIESLSKKKNLILQGPPGTGKTWLAKKLAFVLIGRQDDSKIKPVQFHPNLSYEDFVRGWRPSGDGKLTLVDGPFVVLRNEAENDPDTKYVMVIEEINRGNPAQIFGEMLTLLEADKRTPSEALELVYKRDSNEKFHIPENVYVIGTMNIADRSLALVDLALRRRFAFVDLEPSLGEPWRKWVHSQFGIDMDTLRDIENRIVELNQTIKDDATLGPQYRVGHSYVTPQQNTPIDDGRNWFRQVVDTEIARLLDEYWYDDIEKSNSAKKKLLEGF